MSKKLWIVLCLVVFSCHLAATENTAAPEAGRKVTPAAEQMVRQTIHGLSATAQIDSIQLASIPGFYQVIASGQMLYVSTDGKYIMHGDLIDVGRHVNVGDEAWSRFRREELAKVPRSERIVYAPAHPKYTVTVFTDVSCGFCRALHEQMAAFNKAGIAVEYLAWPRQGVLTTAGRPTPTYTEMVSVWCAKDRKAAFTATQEGHVPPAISCANPVKDEFNLGVKLGVDGTPTIIADDGRVLGGYVTPGQLLHALENAR